MTDKLYFNGIDGVTGKYLLEPMDYAEAASIVQHRHDESQNVGLMNWIKSVWWKISQTHLGLPLGVDPTDIKQAGWGIVFLSDEAQDVKDALQPLIDHRRQQIGDSALKVLTYPAGQSWADWLGNHGVSAGTVEPTLVPLYLLLIGDPNKIDFTFGHLLSVEYAVGRLHFETAEEYSSYAQSLISYETVAQIPNSREVTFFSPRHEFDRATQLSADWLVKPLIAGGTLGKSQLEQSKVAERWGFRSRELWGESATKAKLKEIVTPSDGGKSPALLFSAGHGVGFPLGHEAQSAKQGALVCQNWPGFGGISEEHYFSAADLTPECRVHGMVMFHFACYGAGTPSHDRFVHKPGKPPAQIAHKSFLAGLPKAWLTHPQGGALACLGHVERAWGCSIRHPQSGPQLLPFRNAVGRILSGQPIGYALKDFFEKYAALSVNLAGLLERANFGEAIPDRILANAWIERNDAEGYALLGDPAVRVRTELLS